ncbi:MAG: C1 family peptidase [Flavobacteriales bacterium]
MRKLILFPVIAAISISAAGQQTANSYYVFKDVRRNDVVAVEDQCATGTCWSFATTSFLEAELLRKSGKRVDLSEMYTVRMTYPKKADSYVRFQGTQQFGPGGLAHDVIDALEEFGLVPEVAFSGFINGQKTYDHGALDAELKKEVDLVLSQNLNQKDQMWKLRIDEILNRGIGVPPTNFVFDNKSYTPVSFRDEMGLNPADYVSLSSFSHHGFYKEFVLEVPDNWAKGSFYNLPMEELVRVMREAVMNGYTIAWDADVSEEVFSFSLGVAILPKSVEEAKEMGKRRIAEITPTQAERQSEFDRFQTTDDHLMHIIGLAKDETGALYFITKNSWGTGNVYGGYQYVSEAYAAMKTVGILLHKDAIPTDIRKKLGL